MRFSRLITAGILDSGFASLATFAIGLYAARLLDPELLGVYALFFSAFVMASAMSAQLLYVPAEAWAVNAYTENRQVLLRQTARFVWISALIAPLATMLAVVLRPEVSAPDAVSGIALTAAVCAMISPVQDHCRRTLHLASLSTSAAAVSAVQCLIAVFSLWWLHTSGVPRHWIPFGALSIANVFSLTAAYALSGCWRLRKTLPMRLGELVRSGRWLVSASLLSRGADFSAAALIGGLGGAAALGFAEAARVVAQPVVVLGTGLGSVLGPRAMEAAALGDRARASSVGRKFIGAVAGAGLLYLAFCGLPWWGNPFARLVPAAYELPGLVVATVIAATCFASAFVWASELIAAGRARWIVPVDAVAASSRVLAAGTAGALGAYAAPLGVALLGAARALGYRGARTRHYGRLATVEGSTASLTAQAPGGQNR